MQYTCKGHSVRERERERESERQCSVERGGHRERRGERERARQTTTGLPQGKQQTHTGTHEQGHPRAHMHTHTHTQTHTQARTHSLTYSLTHSLIHARTHARTHAHTHSLTHPLTPRPRALSQSPFVSLHVFLLVRSALLPLTLSLSLCMWLHPVVRMRAYIHGASAALADRHLHSFGGTHCIGVDGLGSTPPHAGPSQELHCIACTAPRSTHQLHHYLLTARHSEL